MPKQFIIYLTLFFFIIATFYIRSCASAPEINSLSLLKNIKSEPIARVLLTQVDNTPILKLRVDGAYRIYSFEKKTLIAENKLHLDGTIALQKGNLIVNSVDLEEDDIELKPEKDGAIVIGEINYRGYLRIKRSKDKANCLRVINYVPLESYLYSVVGAEIGDTSPQEAQKAQAVASRTFALLYIINYRSSPESDLYDVKDDTSFQVYKGMKTESYETRSAVNDTNGIIVIGDELFLPFYHSTCGGGTEPAHKIFDVQKSFCLIGRVCNFCKESKYFSWSVKVSKEDLKKYLKLQEKKNISITKIEPTEILPQGHISTLNIFLSDGETISSTAKNFRLSVGAQVIRSTRFKVKTSDGFFIFEGNGWGHGVGMCQVGAISLAKQKFSFSEIIKFYYSGASLYSIYSQKEKK